VVVQPAPPQPAVAPAETATGPAPAGSLSPTPAKPDPTEPGSITEVGIQRLPGYAYPEPQTRGLKHGSLWLTFHGLQWPYMPAMGKGSRFVLGVSGWGWVDTSYEKFGPWGTSPSIQGQSNIKYWKQQSRLVVRATPTYTTESGLFIQGQVELVGTGDQTVNRSATGGADTDDLWLRFGKWNQWDIQVGRYEGWEVFHLGMGLDQNTFERSGAQGIGESAYQIQFYGLTDNQFRPPGASGNFAFHYYPLPYLRFEVLGMAGSATGPMYATRPVAILDFGWLKLKGGVEYQKVLGFGNQDQTDTTSRGVGGAVQFVLDPHVEFGLNAAQGTVVSLDDKGMKNLKGTYTRTSYGAFLNVSNGHQVHNLIFGLGLLYTTNLDQNDIKVPGKVDDYWHYQSFVAVQYVYNDLFYVKLVGAYARAHWSTFDPALVFDDEVYSARLRFSFYF